MTGPADRFLKPASPAPAALRGAARPLRRRLLHRRGRPALRLHPRLLPQPVLPVPQPGRPRLPVPRSAGAPRAAGHRTPARPTGAGPASANSAPRSCPSTTSTGPCSARGRPPASASSTRSSRKPGLTRLARRPPDQRPAVLAAPVADRREPRPLAPAPAHRLRRPVPVRPRPRTARPRPPGPGPARLAHDPARLCRPRAPSPQAVGHRPAVPGHAGSPRRRHRPVRRPSTPCPSGPPSPSTPAGSTRAA